MSIAPNIMHDVETQGRGDEGLANLFVYAIVSCLLLLGNGTALAEEDRQMPSVTSNSITILSVQPNLSEYNYYLRGSNVVVTALVRCDLVNEGSGFVALTSETSIDEPIRPVSTTPICGPFSGTIAVTSTIAVPMRGRLDITVTLVPPILATGETYEIHDTPWTDLAHGISTQDAEGIRSEILEEIRMAVENHDAGQLERLIHSDVLAVASDAQKLTIRKEYVEPRLHSHLRAPYEFSCETIPSKEEPRPRTERKSEWVVSPSVRVRVIFPWGEDDGERINTYEVAKRGNRWYLVCPLPDPK